MASGGETRTVIGHVDCQGGLPMMKVAKMRVLFGIKQGNWYYRRSFSFRIF
ncbi:hypothetical protein JCM19237_2708 [Photobacterium aphoticum]|uniref:Uncharacterized protein n=1 Tax=Photobacterium aphoticum TaxID=754436 RepID=A0A090QUN7_9GAMM|nr:hypothetical protein JCM19237_2708 [Photobacterium aphoticum]